MRKCQLQRTHQHWLQRPTFAMWGQLCLTLHRDQTRKHLIYAKTDDRQMLVLWSRALFYWLGLAGTNYNRTVLEQKTFIWRVLGTLRASMTRSRASSSPSRMLKSISSSDLDRLSIFMLNFEDTWKGEEKNLDAVNQITKKRVLCFELHPCSSTSQIQWQSAVAPDMWCGPFEISLHSNLTAVQPCHPPPPRTNPTVAASQTSNCTLGKWMRAAFPLKRDQSHCCFHTMLHLSDVWEDEGTALHLQPDWGKCPLP